MRPNNLLSGQIDKLLNVGEIKINPAKSIKVLLSTFSNFNFKIL